MRRVLALAPLLPLLAACSSTTSYVHSDAALGRVVVYRNGIAYFERTARVDGDALRLAVPADKVDDFLKSLTVVDAKTGKPAPVSYPTDLPADHGGLIDMKIGLGGGGVHDLLLSYVTEAPSWKPSYRVVLGKGGKVNVQGWAIVDNTSGEDWQNVQLGVGSSSALSFRFDLRSIRSVRRDTLQSDGLFALAPPTGGATYGVDEAGKSRVVAELPVEALDERVAGGMPASDSSAQVQTVERKASGSHKSHEPTSPVPMPTVTGQGASLGRARSSAGAAESQVQSVARALSNSKDTVVVEGFADPNDGDKNAASLDRANRARDQLVRNGVDASRVVAIGRGEQAGRGAGVRVYETRERAADVKPAGVDAQAEPIGSSHFESTARMSVPRGTSAMVSILSSETQGQVVYYLDPESPRGNTNYPFKAVRIVNPTDSVLESGPVTVFGEGKFIGEGLAEPIPAHAAAFVPFALDRQIVVEKKEDERDKIARILTVQRGVFSTEVKHTRKTTLALHNRLDERATVYVRHTVPEGYTLSKPVAPERLGAARLLKVTIEPHGTSEIEIEEETPLYRTADVRSSSDMELVNVYLSSAALEGPLKEHVAELFRLQRDMANVDQQIATARDAIGEYRARMDELHAQVVTLRAVRSAGPLIQNLEKKLGEVSDRVSKATLDLVALEEKLMVARIKFQDGVAELTLEKKDGDGSNGKSASR